MTSTFSQLLETQNIFKEFVESSVHSVIDLSESEKEYLGFYEIAKRIEDVNIREQYRKLAIELLNANIEHYRPDGTSIDVPNQNNTVVVVTTLAISALTLHFGNAVAALFSAALWYWFVSDASRRRHEQKTQEVKEHNENVAEWADTLEGWEEERDELQYL